MTISEVISTALVQTSSYLHWLKMSGGGWGDATMIKNQFLLPSSVNPKLNVRLTKPDSNLRTRCIIPLRSTVRNPRHQTNMDPLEDDSFGSQTLFFPRVLFLRKEAIA